MNVLYFSVERAGGSTTLARLGERAQPPIAPRRWSSIFADAPYDIGWRHRGEVRRVTVMQAWGANRQSRELVTFLPRVDGAVFVMDARRDAAVTTLAARAADLAGAGRDIAAIPLVVQLNKRDVMTARLSVPEARAALYWPGGLVSVVESVATRGDGVREALDALLDSLA